MAARKRKVDEMTAFKEFISAMGGEVLTPTNPWELIRFRGNGVTSIIYRDKKDNRTYTGEAWLVWTKWKDGDSYRLAEATSRNGGAKMAPLDRAIAERDGDKCFFCDLPFDECDVRLKRTREHLVATTAGGPSHISNLFHAHRSCNQIAGHLSAPEKIRMRERNLFGGK